MAITRGLPERFLFSFFFLRREGVVARGMMKRVERERERERDLLGWWVDGRGEVIWERDVK